MLSAGAEHGEQMSAGDFIRWCKQLLDLLDQLAGAAPAPGADGHGADRLATTARAAAAAVRRGVVAQSMGP